MDGCRLSLSTLNIPTKEKLPSKACMTSAWKSDSDDGGWQADVFGSVSASLGLGCEYNASRKSSREGEEKGYNFLTFHPFINNLEARLGEPRLKVIVNLPTAINLPKSTLRTGYQ